MLRGWRMRFPRIFDVWHKRTVTHSPDIRPIRNLQELVHNYSASFLCAEERGDKRARHSSGSPHQRAAWNWGRVSQENLVLCHALDPGVKLDLHAAALEHLPRMSTQTFTQFWQDHRPGMHEHNSQHSFTQIGIVRQRVPHEVIYRRNLFHAGKSAPRHYESK